MDTNTIAHAINLAIDNAYHLGCDAVSVKIPSDFTDLHAIVEIAGVGTDDDMTYALGMGSSAIGRRLGSALPLNGDELCSYGTIGALVKRDLDSLADDESIGWAPAHTVTWTCR